MFLRTMVFKADKELVFINASYKEYKKLYNKNKNLNIDNWVAMINKQIKKNDKCESGVIDNRNHTNLNSLGQSKRGIHTSTKPYSMLYNHRLVFKKVSLHLSFLRPNIPELCRMS